MSKKLDELKKKKQQLEAQIKELEAKERSKQRKLETRKKIILGGALLTVLNKKGDQATIAEVYDYAKKTAQKETDKEILG